MAGTDAASGVTTPHGDVVVPLHDGPGITATAGVTPREPSTDQRVQGTVMPTTAMFAEQAAAGTADCAAAMDYAMNTRTSMLDHYHRDILPQGAAYGDLMQFPPSGEDPGAGVGNTAPYEGFYDPPRDYGGDQGAPGYQGQAR